MKVLPFRLSNDVYFSKPYTSVMIPLSPKGINITYQINESQHIKGKGVPANV